MIGSPPRGAPRPDRARAPIQPAIGSDPPPARDRPARARVAVAAGRPRAGRARRCARADRAGFPVRAHHGAGADIDLQTGPRPSAVGRPATLRARPPDRAGGVGPEVAAPTRRARATAPAVRATDAGHPEAGHPVDALLGAAASTGPGCCSRRPTRTLAGWFTGAAAPGRAGPDRDRRARRLAGRTRGLPRLKTWPAVTWSSVGRSDGRTATYRVTDVQTVDKDRFPTRAGLRSDRRRRAAADHLRRRRSTGDRATTCAMSSSPGCWSTRAERPRAARGRRGPGDYPGSGPRPGRRPDRPDPTDPTGTDTAVTDLTSPTPGPTYLDHAATTPMLDAAVAAMAAALRRTGNASSLHSAGRRARRVVEESRERIAEAVGARPSEVVLTTGGTESDNLAVKGLYWARRAADPRRTRVLVVGDRAPRGARLGRLAGRARGRRGRAARGRRRGPGPPGDAARGAGRPTPSRSRWSR